MHPPVSVPHVQILSILFRPALPTYFQSFKYVGTELTWVGEGVDEYGHVKGDPENIVVKVDPRYFRPTEVELLLVRGVGEGVAWLDLT